MLPKIPPNTYPLRLSTTVAYWQAIPQKDGLKLDLTGRVPMWVGYHDGGGVGRALTILLIRIRPDMEIMLVGKFREELVWERTERAIKKRLSKSNWPDRSWYLSHIIYLARPPKKRSKAAIRERGRSWFAHLCSGKLNIGRDRRLMLAYIPLRRLKLVANPGKKGSSADADVLFEIDPSKNQRKNIVRFVTALMELERWEQELVHTALGHLLGPDYLLPLSQAAERFIKATGAVVVANVSNKMRELLRSPPEEFRMPQWLREPSLPNSRLFLTGVIFLTRFPIGHGPDPEFSVRPWLPEVLQDIITMKCPMGPAIDFIYELKPDPKSHAVLMRPVLGELQLYRPVQEENSDELQD